jgi:hypothetical protein
MSYNLLSEKFNCMKISEFYLAFLAASWCYSAHSAPVTWTFENTTFSDSNDFGVVEGSFDYDATTNTYSNINIKSGATVNGSTRNQFSAITYTNALPSVSRGTVNFTAATGGASPVGQRVLQLIFSGTGQQSFAFLLEAQCRVANPDCSTYDTLTIGYRTTYAGRVKSNFVPAPAPAPAPAPQPTPVQQPRPIPSLGEWSLLLLGLLMVGLTRRIFFIKNTNQ